MRGIEEDAWEIIGNLETVWAVVGRREIAVVGLDSDRQVITQISGAVTKCNVIGGMRSTAERNLRGLGERNTEKLLSSSRIGADASHSSRIQFYCG